MGTILYILWVIYKVILALAVLNFIVFWILYGFKKSWAVTRWLLVVILLLPLHLLSPLAALGYFTDRFILTRWITWIWMDDSRIDKTKDSGYANDYWVVIQDAGKTKETFLIALLWHIRRNRVYNLLNQFKVPNSTIYNSDGKRISNNKITNVEFIANNLQKKDGQFIDQDGNWVTMAGLKYIPKRPEDDIWQVNTGDVISKLTSIIGKGGIWYKVGDWFSFRYSSCKIVNLWLFGKRWRTIKIGTNSNRPVISIKHQKIKEWK